MRLLMTDPRHFNVYYQINPWMEPAAWSDDAARAAAAGSKALRDAILAAGGEVETLPAVEGLPDLVFPANAAVVLDGKVLVARFMCPERQGEEAVFRAAFEGLRARGIVNEVVELPEGVLQEGAGDAIWDVDRGLFWVGHGQRSTQSSIAVIEQTFGQKTVALQLASPRYYHLDTCFCPLSGGKVLYYPPAFTREALAAIHAHVAPQDRIEATDEEAGAFCVNAVNIGRTIIMARAPDSLHRKLAGHGYTLREVDLAPFILSGGGAYCMTLRLDRTSTAAALTLAAEWPGTLGSPMRDPDAVIIGGGHNGLVCAFYLARAGLKVQVLERRAIVGGAAVTEEFHPGYRNSTASYTVSLLNPKVIADMQLGERGLRIVERPLSNFLPLEDGYLKLGGGLARTQAEVAKFSTRDAERLPQYYAALEAVADVLRDLALMTPPNAGGGLPTLVAAARQGRQLARLSLPQQRDLLDLFTKSAREFLDGWFESNPIKAVFGFDAVVGNFASPDAPGSAYVLLHHVFGEVNGNKGCWGHAIGGMGAITAAMRAACESVGVAIETDAPVARVLVERGRTVGVGLEDGREIRAAIVAANVGPRLLYEKLIAPDDLDTDFRRRIAGYKMGTATFRMNVALSELPRFNVLPEAGEHHQSGIIIAPSLDYMDRAFTDAKATGMSKQPIVEMLIPSTMDSTLAPPGHHVASLFCQHFAPGPDWDARREEAADLIIDTVTAHAPNFRASIIARQIHSPLDLERKFGLTGGDIFHGRLSLDQLWAARPVLGHGAYRGPLKGLYMCGSGAHPGGGVTGAPGHNAAREILKDRSPLRRVFR